MSNRTRKRFAALEARAREMGHELVLVVTTSPVPAVGETLQATFSRLPGEPAGDDLSAALDKVEEYLDSPEAAWRRDGNAERARVKAEFDALKARLAELAAVGREIDGRLAAGYDAYVKSRREDFGTVVAALSSLDTRAGTAGTSELENETSTPAGATS